jgi:hypothetical protein
VRKRGGNPRQGEVNSGLQAKDSKATSEVTRDKEKWSRVSSSLQPQDSKTTSEVIRYKEQSVSAMLRPQSWEIHTCGLDRYQHGMAVMHTWRGSRRS